MSKKSIFLFAMVASFVLVASLGFSSCNKGNDGVPTIEEKTYSDQSCPYVICRHCGERIFQGETHTHYYLATESCVDGAECIMDGKYHRHIIHNSGSKWFHSGGGIRN